MIFKNKKISSSLLILFLSCLNTNTLNATDDTRLISIKSSVSTSIKKLNKKQKLSTNGKISSTIQRLIDKPNLIKANTSLKTKTLLKKNPFQKAIQTNEQFKVQIYLKVNSVAKNQLAELENIGLEIEITNLKLKKIQGWINISNINQLAELDNVVHIFKPSYGHSNAGSRTTQGDAILLSNIIRAEGFTGQGVKVGIISDGSNGLTAAQASGDLPENVIQFESCVIGNESDHCAEGTAMAEIIHDIAPDAELAIADALDTTLEFIQRLDQLANDFEADIIVDDLSFFREPYFEDGDVAQAINELPDNVIYISAAGNSADEHIQNSFVPGEELTIDLTALGIDDLTFQVTLHNFGSATGQDSLEHLPFTIGGGVESCVVIQWNDPFANDDTDMGINAINDYDLYIFNSPDLNPESLVAASLSPFDSIEDTCVTNDQATSQTFYLVVGMFSGEEREIEIFFTNGQPTIPSQFLVAENSVFGHAASERAIAVGTINIQDPLQDDIASFSSQGPSRIDFPARQDRQKPEIAGVDGVSVTGSGGFVQNFTGTSAAAPHIAGIAALLKSARPAATRNQIEDALLSGAVDLGTPGPDNIFGTGRANAEDSLELILANDFDILDFLPAIIEAAKNKN